MTMKHTPGPWRMETNSQKPLVGCILAGTEAYPEVIAVMTSRKQAGQTDANARLIAAAPDMLAALKLYISQEGGPGYVGPFIHPSKIAEVARAAIAKAEGGSNV